ncbi:MAG: hypothetical protein ACI37Z_03720, partial [Candidatus Gastranaerophilaceae bacterium]
MKSFFIKTLLIIFFISIFSNQVKNQEIRYLIKPDILKVIDGDTVLIKTKEGTASDRLTGIDCYETKMNSHIKY